MAAPGGGWNIVVLERVEPGVTPAYCIHGQATCARCGRWVWLGDNSYKAVKERRVLPVCHPCAEITVGQTGVRPVGHILDHRRADGPH